MRNSEDNSSCFSASFFLDEKICHGICHLPLKEGTSRLLLNDSDLMVVNKDWTEGSIICQSDHSQNSVELFLLQMFYTHAVRYHMIQLHSSSVIIKKKGILFLGPSGIGKTTQAELWNQYRGAKIINGDIGFVQETKEGFLAWGTPWHGSSPYCENTSVLLHAMVVLKQAPENKIRRLDGFEKVKEVADSIFYPTWLENGMELCLEVLNHLLERVPVYELSCRPDEEAVRITENTIF